MDQLIEALISGNLNTTSLLLLFILGILTKRFVPWWVHDEALQKLKQYEQSAPELLDEISTLIDLLNDPEVTEVLSDRQADINPRNVHQKSQELRKVVREHRQRLPHVERGRHIR